MTSVSIQSERGIVVTIEPQSPRPILVQRAGVQGVKGDVGATGPANTLTIGSVTDGETADASITGTSPNQELNLVLPKGDKGDAGSDGSKGDDGLSAYDVAVGDGFEGTKEEWLDSLIGPPGNDGSDGQDGQPGQDGSDGQDGSNGSDGWTPIFALEADGDRRVQKVVDWIGGTGTKPDVDVYVSGSGFVESIGAATNIRGASGSGTGDMLAATYDPTGIAEDAFARSNHTGTQAISTINGLETALSDKVAKAGETGIGGFTADGQNLGNLTGTVTPVPTTTSNFKYGANVGAFTLAAPTTGGYYNIAILVTNAPSGAGAMTPTGFDGTPKGTFSTDADKEQLLIIESFGSKKFLTIVDKS